VVKNNKPIWLSTNFLEQKEVVIANMKDIENRWFPPSPHKEAVIDFLNRGRAHIEEKGEAPGMVAKVV
jgi:hypothetical protein